MKTITLKEAIGRMEIDSMISQDFRDGFLKLLQKEKERLGECSKDFTVGFQISAGSRYSVNVNIWVDDSQWKHPLWPKVEMHIREEQ